MEEYISITELLNRIKKQRKIVLELDHKYLDPDEFKKSKSLFSLYNPSRDVTVNGIDIDKSKSDIIKQFESITSNIDILRHLLIIKEQVNSTFKLVVPDILLGDIKNNALSFLSNIVFGIFKSANNTFSSDKYFISFTNILIISINISPDNNVSP